MLWHVFRQILEMHFRYSTKQHRWDSNAWVAGCVPSVCRDHWRCAKHQLWLMFSYIDLERFLDFDACESSVTLKAKRCNLQLLLQLWSQGILITGTHAVPATASQWCTGNVQVLPFLAHLYRLELQLFPHRHTLCMLWPTWCSRPQAHDSLVQNVSMKKQMWRIWKPTLGGKVNL